MRVLIAVEDSPYSRELIDEVVKRRWPRDTSFKVLTVVTPLPPAAALASADSLTIQELRHKEAEALCSEYRHILLNGIAGSDVHFEVREGHVNDEIVCSAVRWGADRIIMGANTGLASEPRPTGSSSKMVARHSPCTVEIIVPPSHRTAKREASALALT